MLTPHVKQFVESSCALFQNCNNGIALAPWSRGAGKTTAAVQVVKKFAESNKNAIISIETGNHMRGVNFLHQLRVELTTFKEHDANCVKLHNGTRIYVNNKGRNRCDLTVLDDVDEMKDDYIKDTLTLFKTRGARRLLATGRNVEIHFQEHFDILSDFDEQIQIVREEVFGLAKHNIYIQKL